MFEEINQHRLAVAEQIQKACEIGFTGNELEKAHKVGDIHPNGKWVWTQLPSGKYDWRVIKKTSAGSGAAAPATAQKTAQSGKKEDHIKGFINILKQKPNERHLEQMDVDELKRFIDAAHKCWLDDENLNRSTRLQCKEWRDLAKKELASKDEEARATQQENKYRKQHPNSTTKNSDIQQQASEGKKKSKVSVFVTKTMDEIKKTVGYRNYTDEKMASIAKKIQENEELAKKVMGGKFPTASWSSIHPNEESVAWGKDELIFSAYKSVHSSRYAAHDGQMDYHYSVKIRYYGNTGAKEIARGSYSSGRYGGTAAEAKKECKIDALLRLIGE